jgi:hypothetical protein
MCSARNLLSIQVTLICCPMLPNGVTIIWMQMLKKGWPLSPTPHTVASPHLLLLGPIHTMRHVSVPSRNVTVQQNFLMRNIKGLFALTGTSLSRPVSVASRLHFWARMIDVTERIRTCPYLLDSDSMKSRPAPPLHFERLLATSAVNFYLKEGWKINRIGS